MDVAERPLVFAHVVFNMNLVAHNTRDIRARIYHQLELWGRGIHEGLVGDTFAEGRAREGCV